MPLARLGIVNVRHDLTTSCADWNRTRLQRHIQQAEAERHLAAAALAASGLDVLLMEVM